jgi:hypothetical protein
MRLRLPLSLTSVFALGLAVSAMAQTRPLLTEEAHTAPAGSIVLEAGASAIDAEPSFLSGAERTRIDVPTLRLVYSPADNVEIDVDWVGRVIAVDDPDYGTVSDWGDVTMRAKVRFAEEREGRPAFAARFGVTLPETSFTKEALGPNTLRMSAQLLLSKKVGAVETHLNAGLSIQDDPLDAHEQRDFLHYGVALELPFSESWRALAEVAGLAGSGRPGADEHAEVRAGVRLGSGSLRGDVAVRRGLLEADGKWGVSAGVSWKIQEHR